VNSRILRRVVTMSSEQIAAILVRLLIALAFGGVIGLERSYHGRPAGFRTHALVCLASAALMVVTVYETAWFQGGGGSVRGSIDPTRIAQGIMTGIGFLGAGVIMKDGLSVRGLTTAASIWITAGIGILVGIGFYGPAALTTTLALGALSMFRWVERRIRTESYAQCTVRFETDRALGQPELASLADQHGFSIANVTHHYRRSGAEMEYQMILRSLDPGALIRFSDALRRNPDVAEFRIAPTGD
jgi:putative Mg2+ transporter-C (MgtC) family protein